MKLFLIVLITLTFFCKAQTETGSIHSNTESHIKPDHPDSTAHRKFHNAVFCNVVFNESGNKNVFARAGLRHCDWTITSEDHNYTVIEFHLILHKKGSYKEWHIDGSMIPEV